MFDLGPITVDIQPVFSYLAMSTPFSLAIDLFLIGGWAVFGYFLLEWGLMLFSDEYKEGKATKQWEWITLAVDVPMLNIQTPKAVEQLFSHLAGALDEPNIAAKYYRGHKQRWFSFEIISIEGYIQFVIRTEKTLRDLVEAAMYAQYPDAEVIEIEDYTKSFPDTFPNDTHDIWAVDFGLAEDQSIPIRTYREFEHNISKDTVLKDPMGTFLESFSRIGPGEQMWFQIIIQPVNNGWKKKAIEKVEELLGKKKGKKGIPVVDSLGDVSVNMVKFIHEQFFGALDSDPKKKSAEEGSKKMSDLTPGQTKLIEAIEDKIMKIGFKTKLRGIYLAEKSVFRPERGAQALIGAVNQYNIPSHNSLIPKFGVGASYIGAQKKKNEKKTLLMQSYKKRKAGINVQAADPYILNIEELATIWHFPMSHVKTPLLQKTTDKKSEPPAGLPVELFGDISVMEPPPAAQPLESAPIRYDLDTGDGYRQDQKFG